MGPPRSAQKASEKLPSRNWVSRAVRASNPRGVGATNTGVSRCSTKSTRRRYARNLRRRYRILIVLVGSDLPRVTNRTTAAMIPSTTTARTMFNGVNTPFVSGVADGVGLGGGAFFAASMLRTYCNRCTVS